MKKLFIAIVALVMSVSANAFEFDGVDLNASMLSITRNISLRGYVNDEATGGLKGQTHGMTLYMRFDWENVSQKGKCGQLFVDAPQKGKDVLKNIIETFNVIYHQVETETGAATYLVDEDGTTLSVEENTYGIRYTYRTPYYKAK